MKNKLKILLLIFIYTFSLFILCACNKTEDTNVSDNTPAEIIDEDDTAEEVDEIKPDIPDDVNMNGKAFNIMIHQHYDYAPLNVSDISVDEFIGESINDAAYNRNIKIEEELGCKINSREWTSQADGLAYLNRLVKAQTNEYDICVMRTINFLQAVTSGLLTDIAEVPYVDTDAAWWDTNAINTFSFGDSKYAVCGDFTMGYYLPVWNVYFNKDLMKDFGIKDNLYSLVKEGKWTFQKMYEIGREVKADLNSDGIWDVNDRFGITHVIDAPTALLNSFGMRYADIDSEGMPYFTFGEAAIERIIHIAELMRDHETFFNTHMRTNNGSAYEAQLFVRNQTMFSLGGIYYYGEIREMDAEFGILPYPKYNEEQKKHNTAVIFDAVPVVTIPTTNYDLENTGIFMELYAYEGNKTIRPMFYVNLLERKITRDEESLEMLELIFSNMFIDIGTIYDFGSIARTLNDRACNGNTQIASAIESARPRIDRDIEKLIDVVTNGD